MDLLVSLAEDVFLTVCFIFLLGSKDEIPAWVNADGQSPWHTTAKRAEIEADYDCYSNLLTKCQNLKGNSILDGSTDYNHECQVDDKNFDTPMYSCTAHGRGFCINKTY